MAFLNIVSWNVRNLSQTMSWKGVRGNGLSIQFRLQNVLINLKKMRVDIAFLMETGSDGKEVANFFSSNPDYVGVASDLTQTESYVMVFRKELSSGFVAQELIGNNNAYRKGWLVSFGFNEGAINFAVLHAPSPLASKSNRLNQIKQVAQAAIAKSNNRALLFMGDLNMKMNEQNDLYTKMTQLHLKHLGPFEQSNNNNNSKTPALTSLRKYKTMLKNKQNYQQEVTDSQPYDQFWSNASLVGNQANVASVRVTGPATGHFMKWLGNNLSYIVNKELTMNMYNFRGQKKITRQTALFSLYDSFLANRMALKFYNTRHVVQLVKLPVNVWMKDVDKIKYFIGELMQMDSLMNNDDQKNNNNGNGGDPSIILTNAQFSRTKNVLGKANAAISLLVSACEMHTNGVYGYKEWEKTVYEFAVSDHKPISITIKYPDNVYNKIYNKNSKKSKFTKKNQLINQ